MQTLLGSSEFMQKFQKILCKIMKKKAASPFLKPDNAVTLGQDEVIRKQMDLGTVLNRMEAKEEDGRYKNIYDICADVRLVFTNAMQYNAPGSKVHTKAQKLSSKFEKKWLPLSLEVANARAPLDMQLAELGEEVWRSCYRELSAKLVLKDNIAKLSAEDSKKAVELAAKYDPDYVIPSANADIDLTSMSVIARWMLYKFVEKCIRKRR